MIRKYKCVAYVGWFVGWLACVVWFVGWFFGWFVGCFFGWFVGWLVCCLCEMNVEMTKPIRNWWFMVGGQY